MTLGESCLRNGLLRDAIEGVKWLTLSADAGHTDAQYSLGRYYFKRQQYTGEFLFLDF
jgi:TPR repeat protein